MPDAVHHQQAAVGQVLLEQARVAWAADQVSAAVDQAHRYALQAGGDVEQDLFADETVIEKVVGLHPLLVPRG